jgi:hypothetical protein
MPDGILWMATNDYVAFKANIILVGDNLHTEGKRDRLNSCLYYYKAPDLQAIIEDINMIGWIWSEMIAYLRELRPQRRSELYASYPNVRALRKRWRRADGRANS